MPFTKSEQGKEKKEDTDFGFRIGTTKDPKYRQNTLVTLEEKAQKPIGCKNMCLNSQGY